jgi:hypothetical protein
MPNQYRLVLGIRAGGGTITVNGSPPVEFYEEGTSLTIAISLDAGFNSVQWFQAPTATLLSSSTSFSYLMPSRDAKLYAIASGANVPVDGYGEKYSGDYGTNYGADCWNLKIYEDGYGGASSSIDIADIQFNWGNQGDDPLKTIIGSSVDFTIAGDSGDYDEFLYGGNRTWKVELYQGAVLWFVGFIQPDFITNPYSSGKKLYSFTATDGLKALDSIRSQFSLWPNPRTQAISAIVGGLNQSFVEQRPVNIGCEVHETRMDDTDCVFEQFNIPDNAVYNDGEIAKFTDGVRVENEQLYLSETLERMVNPFLCRVFLWKNEFWVLRLPELSKASYKKYKFLSDISLDGTATITNGEDISCDINRPEETARRVYTEFNAYLNLGVLDIASKGGVFDADFKTDEWFVNSPASPYAGIYQLREWDYVNAIPTNQPSSVPTGTTGRVQYATQGGDEFAQIWVTTASGSFNSTNSSYISANTASSGLEIQIAQEVANTISVSFEYMVERVSSSHPVSPPSGTHNVAIMIKVGNYYLYRDTPTTFDWYNGTINAMEFAVSVGSAWNSIAINNVPVPTDGNVEVRLYQLVCVSGTANRYAVRYKNFSLKIEQTEGLSLDKIAVKGVTNSPYSNVHPDYNTYIGDAITNNSASAIKLLTAGDPVSEGWSRDGVEDLPLLDVIVQDLANLKGRSNLRILATLERKEVTPYEAILYKGRFWALINYQLDCRRGTARIELFDLGLEPTT